MPNKQTQYIDTRTSKRNYKKLMQQLGRGQLKCDGTRPETRFRLSAKRMSPFQSTRASVQSTTGSRGVRISGSNAGYTMFRSSVKGTGYPLHSPVSPSLPHRCVTVCHHISTGVYNQTCRHKQLTPNYIPIKIKVDNPQNENSAPCWFILYRYITMHGQQNSKK